MKKAILAAFLFSLTGWLVVSLGPRDKGQTVALAAAPGAKAESIARGGLLYDTWWKVVPGAKEPKDNLFHIFFPPLLLIDTMMNFDTVIAAQYQKGRDLTREKWTRLNEEL